MRTGVREMLLAVAALSALPGAGTGAQDDALPSARLVRATRLVVPGAVDSNVPLVWDLDEGVPTLFGTASWGGVPALIGGPALEALARLADAVDVVPHPGDGVWIEGIVPDAAGAWYGYYHHEQPATVCGRADRQIPRIGALRSSDRGRSWQDLGVILEAPVSSHACESSNRFVLGGVGDLTAMLDPEGRYLYLFFSQYMRDPYAQGVAAARLAWADRDEPAGRITVWQRGVWMPAVRDESRLDRDVWDYPPGTPLRAATRPYHDRGAEADVFWGPSIHWNTFLERYVLLMNRTKNESFDNEGIYVAYARQLDDPGSWSHPQKLMNGGGWYPQVAGLGAGLGTDKLAGHRARFFLTGRSEHVIEFER